MVKIAIEKPKIVFESLINQCFIKAKYTTKQQAALVEKLDLVLLKNAFSEANNLVVKINT